jgi:hypothetical protein
MTFSASERQEAKHVMANVHVGSIGSFIGNMGSGNASGTINVSGVSASQILDTASKIRAVLPELEKAGANGAVLTRIIESLEVEAKRDEPNQGLLRNLLSDAHTALVGAAGNLTADGAIAGIAALLRLLGS